MTYFVSGGTHNLNSINQLELFARTFSKKYMLQPIPPKRFFILKTQSAKVI